MSSVFFLMANYFFMDIKLLKGKLHQGKMFFCFCGIHQSFQSLLLLCLLSMQLPKSQAEQRLKIINVREIGEWFHLRTSKATMDTF